MLPTLFLKREKNGTETGTQKREREREMGAEKSRSRRTLAESQKEFDNLQLDIINNKISI